MTYSKQQQQYEEIKDSLLKEYLQFAIELATKAGKMMLKANLSNSLVNNDDDHIDLNNGNHLIANETKKNRIDLVTEFDLAIEKYIFNSLREHYPDHVFIGEEDSSVNNIKNDNRINSNSPTWIVDPIDGTMNFVHHYPLCCVSIGLAISQELVVGVIMAPFIDRLYTAVKGYGARCNGKPIKVSSNQKIIDSLVLNEIQFNESTTTAVSQQHQNAHEYYEERLRGIQKESRTTKPYLRYLFNNLLWKCQSVRYIGSACISLAMVAEGSADVMIHNDLCLWDLAAGYVLVTEAGGTVRTIYGDPFDPHSGTVLATSNPDLAEEVAKLTRGARQAAGDC